MTFGDVEGEEDKLLKKSLVHTYSIEEVLKLNCNYILAPKGAGKSAIFKSFESQYFIDFNYTNKFIVSINRAFIFEHNYLDKSKFSINDEMNCVISWGFYIFSLLLKDIQKNLSNNIFYGELRSKLAKFFDLKEEFQLFNLLDYINELNIGMKFNINGTELNVSPKVNINTPKKTLNLNEIFEIVNEFFYKNNLTALILIDKIDDFVRYEEYTIQKKYVQALYGCIEEIRRLSNITPILFLRTDLFYTLHIDIGLDKVMPRTVDLHWEKNEIIKFIAQRLISNTYIKDNFMDALKINLPKKKKNVIQKIFSKEEPLDVDEVFKKLNHKEYLKFILLFFPQKIYHFESDGRKLRIDFIDWLFTHFTDNNNYISPRVLINFFNKLFTKQYRHFTENPDIVVKGFGICKLTERNGIETLDIFNENVIYETYKEIRGKEIENISSLLKDEKHKKLFEAIRKLIHDNGNFYKKNICFQDFDLQEEDFNHVLNYLEVLGYLKREITVNNEHLYSVPIFYRTSNSKVSTYINTSK